MLSLWSTLTVIGSKQPLLSTLMSETLLKFLLSPMR